MKVLITGGGGYVGRWFASELVRHGHEVVIVDRRTQPLELAEIAYVQLDLLRAAETYHVLHDHNPDVVVHLAARYGRIQGEQRVNWTVRLNAELTAVLARWCGDSGARLCYVSSSEVYGRSDELYGGPRHWHDTHPLNLYGLTKLWGEQVAEHYAPNGLVVARLNMPYGPNDPKGVAPSGRNALHTFLWLANTRQPITVHRDVRRSYTWIGDVVDGLRRTIEHEWSGRYVICRNDDQRTAREVAELACEVAGAPASLIREVAVPRDVTRDKSLDVGSIYELGWKPTVTLEDGARRTFEWIRQFDEQGRWKYE